MRNLYTVFQSKHMHGLDIENPFGRHQQCTKDIPGTYAADYHRQTETEHNT